MKKSDAFLVHSLLFLTMPSIFSSMRVEAETVIYDPTNPTSEVQPIENQEGVEEITSSTTPPVHEEIKGSNEQKEETSNQEKPKNKVESQIKTIKKIKKEHQKIVLTDDFSMILNEQEDPFSGGGGSSKRNEFCVELLKHGVGILVYGRKS